MKIEFTSRASEGVERHIQVSVPAEAVKDAEDKAARRYASTVRLTTPRLTCSSTVYFLQRTESVSVMGRP